MNLDAAVIWKATRSTEMLQEAKAFGVAEDLFVGAGKVAWRFIHSYRDEHGGIPSLGVISENSGLHLSAPSEDEDAAMTYLVDKLHERAIFRSLKYGLDKSYEYFEEGEQDDAASEIIKLGRHLKERKAARVRVRDLREIVPEVKEMYERTKRGEIGIPFPWPTMNEVTLGMWPGTLTFFTARPGVGKCVEETTRIVNPITGVESSIREVVEGPQLGVYSWNDRLETGIDIMPIGAKVDTGTKECLRVHLKTGRSIVVTPEHPFLTPRGWVRADEVGPGVIVGLPSHLPEPQRPEALGVDVVRMLALLLSEGSYSGNHVGFSTADRRMVEFAEAFAVSRGAHVIQRSKYDYDVSVGQRGGVVPNPARELLRQLGIDGTKARDKKIPDQVYGLPDKELSEFLSVFWMADGYVDRGAPGITLASERMVRQIQHLLLRFGVQSSVRYKPINGGFHAWRLRVYSVCWDAFAGSIPLWGEKDLRLQRSIHRDGHRNPNAGKPKRVPAQPGVFWDRVAKIEDAGECRVFDLTVRPTSNFVANDIIVHNTWSAINICYHAWREKHKVLIVSPEMIGVELAERVVARHGRLSYGDLVAGRLGDFGGERALDEAIAEMTGMEGFHVLDDEERLSPDYIEEAVEAVDPDLIAVDSVYMLKVLSGKMKKGAGSKGGRYDRILETVDWLRSFSRRSKKPILAISQLSRDAKMKKGAAERLKQGVGTGGLEDAVAMSDTLFMDAHNLFAMFQDDDMKLDKQMLYVPLKARRQASWSSIVTRWDMSTMNFDQIGTKVESGDDFEDGAFDDVF